MHTGKIAATAAAFAIAALIGQTVPAAAAGSDQNLRYVSRYIERANDSLAKADKDYHGHKAMAMDDIGRARRDIANALTYEKSHEHTAVPMVDSAAEAAFERSLSGSDRSLSNVRAYLQRAVEMLKRDNTDYGGFRVKAIQDIEAARQQIEQAIAYDTGSEQPGQQSSDNNLRYTRAYVERGIDILQHVDGDFGGHRAKAVAAMQSANADIVAALRADRAEERVPAIQDLARPSMQGGQSANAGTIRYARMHVEHAIAMLEHDRHDYSGYRVKAIADLRTARNQLTAALNFNG